MTFLKPSANLFFSKYDPSDMRLGDMSEFAIDNADLFIMGYPDDEGIKLNSGRVGAALAPDIIRKYFYRMTPHVLSSQNMKISDVGNLETENHSLENKHESARENSYLLSRSKKRFIALGSGHDYGYSDSAGFAKASLERGMKPLVINIDAHLDVRPTDKGPHSGTPFRRLLEALKGKVEFVEIGIQPHCNSKDHLTWAKEQGARVYMLDDVLKKNLFKILAQDLNLKNREVFLSIDMDGLNSAEAPGCSSVYTSGLNSLQIFNFIKELRSASKHMSMGIYEVSPALDVDDRTSKLAALMMFHFLYPNLNTTAQVR